MVQFLFQVIYLLLHGLVIVLSLEYATAHLGMAFARPGGMHTPLSIPLILLILFMFRARKITLSLGSYGFVGDLLGMGFLGVDLILPCLIVALTNTQVLPTDGANCRDWV